MNLSERDNRIRKLNELREKGVEPYPYSFERTHSIVEVQNEFDKLVESQVEVKLSGRLMTRRDFGKTCFFDLRDERGKIQLYVRKDEAALLGSPSDQPSSVNAPSGAPAAFSDFLSLIDLGDFVGVKGPLFRTKTGEPSVHVKELTLLAKSLAALPEKFHGLHDTELRLRYRHLDLLSNEETREVFRTRSRVTNLIRRFFDERGFLEVETPMLQPLYGGAAADPFRTHYNALDRDYYLRIAPELYLKRLLVGGYERVYELGKNFRNEGLDRSHNPEYSGFESYEAFVDYEEVMHQVEELFRYIALELKGQTTVTWQGKEYDFGKSWERVEFIPTLKAKIGTDPLSLSESQMREMCKKHGIDVTDKTPFGKMLDKLFSEMIQDHLHGPAFVMDRTVARASMRTEEGLSGKETRERSSLLTAALPAKRRRPFSSRILVDRIFRPVSRP